MFLTIRMLFPRMVYVCVIFLLSKRSIPDVAVRAAIQVRQCWLWYGCTSAAQRGLGNALRAGHQASLRKNGCNVIEFSADIQ